MNPVNNLLPLAAIGVACYGLMSNAYGTTMAPPASLTPIHVKRISMYVHTKMTNTSMTMPKVIQVVERPLLDTEDRCFLDDLVAVRFPRYQLER